MKYLLVIGFILITYLFVLYTFQEKFYFWPTKTYQPPKELNLPFLEKKLIMSDGSQGMIWYVKGNVDMPAILFLHGNSYNLEKFAPYMMPFVNAGYSVFMLEYRGFGFVQGKSSQDNLFSDVTQAFDWIKTQTNSPVIVYGYSFGCAVGMGLTLNRSPEALILQAPFVSLRQLVKEKPVPFASYLLQDSFSSDEFIQQYKNPTLILHGTKDALIPIHHAEILFNLSPSPDKTFIPFKGADHRFFFENITFPVIDKWIQKRFNKGGI